MEPVARAPRRRAARAGTTSCRSRQLDRDLLPHDSVKGSQVLEPLFEFSGACAGCGETPYLKLVTPAVRRPHGRRQRHRLLVDLRRQPADDAVDDERRRAAGPAWSNSLFEDNAEFGLGMRLGLDAQTAPGPRAARRGWRRAIGDDLVRGDPRQPTRTTEPRHRAPSAQRVDRAARRARRRRRRRRRDAAPAARARRQPGAQERVDRRRRRLGLRHRLRRPRPRARRRAATSTSSCSTPRCTRTPAVRRRRRRRAARSPSSRPPARRPARRTSARSPAPTATSTSPRSRWAPTTCRPTKALLEADAWPGPSLVIAYSTCIAHGIDMCDVDEPSEGRRARAATGRSTASTRREDEHGSPFQLDSHKPVDPGRATSSPARPASPSSRAPTPSGPAQLLGAGAGRRRRALALLRAARRRRAHRAARHPARSMRRRAVDAAEEEESS